VRPQAPTDVARGDIRAGHAPPLDGGLDVEARVSDGGVITGRGSEVPGEVVRSTQAPSKREAARPSRG